MKNLNTENHNQVGTLIKNGRLAKGKMTAQELGDIAALSRAYIAKIEAGMRKAPSDEALRRIAKALEIPEKELERAKQLDEFYQKVEELYRNWYSIRKIYRESNSNMWPSVFYSAESDSKDFVKTWSKIADTLEEKKKDAKMAEIIEKLEKMDESGLVYIKRQIEIYEETIAK
jgi:transcriptional regulator with XRE-family HTH domain